MAKILLVEDEASLQATIAYNLKKAGYEIATAEVLVRQSRAGHNAGHARRPLRSGAASLWVFTISSWISTGREA